MDENNIIIQKKLCMLGDFAVGKTSLVCRFIEGRFDDRYLSTIGVKISRRLVNLKGHMPVNLLIWDLAGSEEFTGVQSSYLQGSSAALLVCDLTRVNTYAVLDGYARRIREVNPQAVITIAGNKADLEDQREITSKKLAELANAFDATWFLTSAKTGAGVEEAFEYVTECLLSQS